ncbi:MAG: hypothetical protein LBD67_03775 [Candidatus Accumulibacter sp.]|nr:hypothetical protein [Accumulibacter sp.]
MLSLSKYERTRQGFPKASLISALRLKEFLAFPVLTLRQAQGERTGKASCDNLPSSSSGQGKRTGKTFFDKLRSIGSGWSRMSKFFKTYVL